MAVIAIKPCPKCNSISRFRHCSGSKCIWYTCIKCVPAGMVLCFDMKDKYFVKRVF